jgi:hypothetical protein
MEVGLLVLGLLLGIGLGWYLQDRQQQENVAAHDTVHAVQVRQLQAELKDSDAALAEARERLIALQMEFKALEQRSLPLEADLAQSKRAAQQALELEAKQREVARTLQDQVARLERELAEARKAAAVEPVASSEPVEEAEPRTELAQSMAAAKPKVAASAKQRSGRSKR